MYINSRAMLMPGKTIPTIGTNIDGKYDAVMLISFNYEYKFILFYYLLILIKIYLYV